MLLNGAKLGEMGMAGMNSGVVDGAGVDAMVQVHGKVWLVYNWTS